MAEIVLYDAANSPCARRVRMCLIEKGVPFEIRWLGLGLMDQKQPWYPSSLTRTASCRPWCTASARSTSRT